MRKDKVLKMRVTEEEMARLRVLAGEKTLTDFVLETLFAVDTTGVDDLDYPGWDMVERNRRDRGIKIVKDPVPFRRKSPTILYPGDKEYERFKNMERSEGE